MGAAIGIDLGTTFSVIAWVNPKSGQPEILTNAEGEQLTPSVVWFGSNPPTVGKDAKAQQKVGAPDVASFFKRSLGSTDYRLYYNGRFYTPIDLSALVLKKLKADAEAVLKETVTDAVITVPAYFTNAQRENTIEAGKQAGLNVLRIINEPTAAALAYGVSADNREEMVLVYDLGGGTFDVTLVHITLGSVTVIGTGGDHELGGKDWDDRIAHFLASRFCDEFGFDPLNSPESSGELAERCEDAKRKLTQLDSTQVHIDMNGQRGYYQLTRAKFEELTRDLLERTAQICEQVLSKSIKKDGKGMNWSDVTGVLLVGGSSYMPMVFDYVERMSGKSPRTGVHKDLVVALGAAIQAALDTKKKIRIGGTVHEGGSGGLKTRDVMSHSLGMVTESKDLTRYINIITLPKNTPIPCSQTSPVKLRTRRWGDNELDVYLTQGELEEPTKCTLLGLYKFQGITHVPGGEAVINIQYSYDQNGVMQVSATEKSTGKTLTTERQDLPADMGWLTQPPEWKQMPVHAAIYLCFDLSGSMSGIPLEEAKKAAQRFISDSDLAHCSIGLISFADKCLTTTHACQNAHTLKQGIDSLAIDSGVGYGNSASPFAHTHKLLREMEDPRYIVVLTDGVWNDQRQAISEAKACHAAGIEVVALGFGSADHSFLKDIASTEQGAMMTSRHGLTEAFSTIAQAITEQAGSSGVGGLRFKR